VQDDAGRLDHAPLAVPHPVLYCSVGGVILHKQVPLHNTQDYWQGYIWTGTASCHDQMAQHFTFTVTQFPVRLQAICRSMLPRLARLQFSLSQERLRCFLPEVIHSLPFGFTAVGVTHSRTDVRKSKHRTSCQQGFCCHRAQMLTATFRTHDCLKY
jgi:hypothetical protein